MLNTATIEPQSTDTLPFESRVLEPKHGLPLMVTPKGSSELSTLTDWLSGHREWVEAQLVAYGAILFRGFGVETGQDFEKVALAAEPGLGDDYLGTSPRNLLPGCKHAFTASELPGWYPIPQHCEMSFLKHFPRRLFFSCLVEPGKGGQTPLADFQKVYADLDPAVRDRFEERGIRVIRNYDGPSGGGRFDLWKLKRWDEMFSTTDRAVVEEKAAQQGLEVSWHSGDKLRLVSEGSPTKAHPVTGEPVWFHHLQVFHLSTGPSELRRVHRRTGDLRSLMTAKLAGGLVALKKRFTPAENQALHCTYADGREIPLEDVEHLRDVIWRNLVVFDWRQGDVVAIDNERVSHGRLPYRGDRLVAVCWAE